MITLEQATEWLQEYFQINKMFLFEKLTSEYSEWKNDVCVFNLEELNNKVYLFVNYDPSFKDSYYTFIVPNTKEEFFTVLNILEK